MTTLMTNDDFDFETLPGGELEGCQVTPLRDVASTDRSSSSTADIASALDEIQEFGPERTYISNHGARRLHVLVVDDDPTFAFTCARFLEAAGHLVTIARDSRSAIQVGREQRFDAVVSDINLPDGNGLQVLQNLRLTDAGLPFVLVTGDPQLDTARAAVECGAISYLLKPVSAMQLESVVERAFQARQTAELLAAVKTRGDELLASKQALERAIAGLWIAFQPIVSWSAQGVAGYEVLARTTEPSFADASELIKTAAHLHQLVPLGQRIRRLVAGLMFGHDRMPTVFLNLHALELLDEELYDPASPLAGVADHVYFEITEQAALDDVDDFVRRTRRLRAMGYRIAVSDLAGAGSGLGSLALLEPDAVKMEMSLLRDLPNQAVRRRVVRAALGLCRDLGVPLIAEGIETDEERNSFLVEGGDLMQGFLFGQPDFPPPSPRF